MRKEIIIFLVFVSLVVESCSSDKSQQNSFSIAPTLTLTSTAPSKPSATSLPTITTTSTLTPLPTPTLLGGYSGVFAYDNEDCLDFQNGRSTGCVHTLSLFNENGIKINDLWVSKPTIFGVDYDWSPKGSFITLNVNYGDKNGEYFSAEADVETILIYPDGEKKILPINAWLLPAISPDEKQIVYSTWEGEIYLYNIVTNEVPQKLNLKDSKYIFTPDGNYLLKTYPNFGVYDFNGERITKVADFGFTKSNNPYSLDHKYILLETQKTGMGELFMAFLDGSKIVNISNSGNENDRDPQISQDGKYVLWHADRGDNANNYIKIYVTDLGTMSDPIEIYKVVSNRNPSSDLNVMRDLRWSPDSKLILFSLQGPDCSSGLNQICYFSMLPDGSNLHRLNLNQFGFVIGKWQPTQALDDLQPALLVTTPTP